jgi:large subunit ribosomal protein L18
MSKKVHKKTNPSYVARFHRGKRVRDKISGTADRPRMSVFKSDKHFIVQLIDDEKGCTVVQCSTMSKELDGTKSNVAGAKKVGQAVAEAAKKANITRVVFDRNGYMYHGSIKALAEAARAAGLEF